MAANTKKSTTREKKWSWTPEMIESMIESMKDYKSICEFNAIDFNADKVKLYEEIRKAMASKYSAETFFGPVEVCSPEKPVKDMTTEEYSTYKARHNKEAETVKTGYNRIKEKVKSIRQDYSRAIVSGTRSGSGRVVQAHYDDLSTIWGGSPSTEPLPFGVDSRHAMPEDSLDSHSITIDELSPSTPSSVESSPSASRERIQSADAQAPEAKKRKARVDAPVPKLIDNKRRHLEKKLTSAQRDQKLLEAAKEDAIVRREMMDCFKESSVNTAHAIESMADTMKLLSQSISSGMALLANALATPPQSTAAPAFQQHYSQPGAEPYQSCSSYYPAPVPGAVPNVNAAVYLQSSEPDKFFQL